MNTPKTPIRVIDQQETPAQAEARERLNRLHVEQAGLLAQLLQEEVLPAYAVTVMIELGLVTLHDDLLPCQAGQRYTHWVEHQDAVDAYRERLRTPVPPPE